MRIISLVPSQTELLAALGLDDEVVGLTRFCVHPEGWKREKTIVGGTKQVDVERIRRLRPDLVIANREENTRADVEALRAFAPVHVTDVGTVEEAVAMIRTVGGLVGREAEAEALAARIEAGFADLAPPARRRAAYLIWQRPTMTVGGDTFIHDVLRRGGFDNVFGDRTRYPEVTEADLAEARPDVLFLSSEPYPFGPKHAAAFRDALPGTEIRLVDGERFSWYGPRLLGTPDVLRTLWEAP